MTLERALEMVITVYISSNLALAWFDLNLLSNEFHYSNNEFMNGILRGKFRYFDCCFALNQLEFHETFDINKTLLSRSL